MTALPRYRPSGSFGFSTLLLAPLAAVVGVLTAWLYMILLDWIPFIQISFMLTAGFAGGLAVLAYLVVDRGHCRSTVLGLIAGLLIGVSGLAASYFWTYKHALSNIATAHPEASAEDVAQAVPFQRWVAARQESGWKIGKTIDVTGWGVQLIWGIEGLAVVFGAVIGAWYAASRPYCERCQAWTTDRVLVLQGHTAAAAQAPLDAGDLNAVLDLKEIPEAGRPKAAASVADPVLSLELTGTVCAKCRESAWLTVKALRSHLEKGKVETKKTDLIVEATLDGGQAAKFLARVPELPPAAL